MHTPRLRSSSSAIVALVTLGTVAALLVPGDARTLVERAEPTPATKPTLGGEFLGRVPAAFVPDLGQWQGGARYVARLGPVTALLDQHGWWLGLRASTSAPRDAGARRDVRGDLEPAPAMRGASLRMTFLGGEAAELVAEDQLAGVHNYFLGTDPARWRTNVPRFGAVRYRGLYPGVEVRAYEKNGSLEYDLVLAPGADLRRVQVRVGGACAPLRLEADGTLVIDTAAGQIRQPTPVAYQALAHGKQEVACGYELFGADCFGFVAPTWDGGSELVVDPVLYSTFLGGSDRDIATALSLDAAGVTTVAGHTSSTDFPTTPGVWDTTYNGGGDAFVARLDPRLPAAQQLVYSTFLGGAGNDFALALSVDAASVMTIAGCTTSTDFPTTAGAWDTTYNGGDADAFVARFDPTLPAAQQLIYSTFLGGASQEHANALSVDAVGVATVAGFTLSADFPTTSGAWDTTHNGDSDAFVARLDPRLPSTQQFVYSTFLGGGTGVIPHDRATALSVDAVGVATVAGWTESPDFPTTPGAWDTTFNGTGPDASNGFVARVDPRQPAAQQLLYSTFLGGSTQDIPFAIGVDAVGVATVAGQTASHNFPTTPGAWDTTHNGQVDAFVARLDPRLPTAQQLVYSTFLGASGTDWASALSVDSAGVMTVAGAASIDFPTTSGAWDTTFNGGMDAFVARLDPRLPAARQLEYSTFLGGADTDYALALSVDAVGVATVAGATASTDFPTTPGAWDTTYNGSLSDAFVTRLDFLCLNIDGSFISFGTGCSGGSGSVPVHSASVTGGTPERGELIRYTLSNAASMQPAALFLGFSNTLWNGVPLPLNLAIIGLDPACNILVEGFLVKPFTTDGSGFGFNDIQTTIASAIGTRIFTQIVNVDPGASSPLKVVVSNGLETVLGGVDCS